MQLKYEIEPQNLEVLEIEKIAQDKDKFGVLTFDKAYPHLEQLRQILIEFEKLGYPNLLTRGEIDDVISIKKQLIRFLAQIYSINPEEDPSFNRDTRDRLESEIENFYNDASKRLRSNLVYLRQEAALKSKDNRSLAEDQKAAAHAAAEYQELSSALRKELDELTQQKEEKRTTQGEIAAINLGKYFEAQAEEYNLRAAEWMDSRNSFFGWLRLVIIGNLVLYVYLFLAWKINLWPRMNPGEFFTLEYALVKLALLVLLSYALAFATRNFNINAGLVATNRHRKNVAETLLNILSSSLREEDKGIVVKEATTAMFQNLSVGYLKKEHQSDSGPITEIIRKIYPNER